MNKLNFLILTTMGLISFTAFAHPHKCQHSHTASRENVWEEECGGTTSKMLELPLKFQIRGTYCANPYYADGPDHYAAARVADEIALKHCYPYQVERKNDYTFGDHSCMYPFYGSSAEASYQCAR